MARIYNSMSEPILVVPSTMFVPTGGITIQPGQRSDSLDWSSANIISVWSLSELLVCTFDFGVHAQIQGGNYAMIQPGSYLVYDSNHNVISVGAGV